MSKQFLGFDWFIGPIYLTSAIQGLEMQHFIKPQGNGAYLCFFQTRPLGALTSSECP